MARAARSSHRRGHRASRRRGHSHAAHRGRGQVDGGHSTSQRTSAHGAARGYPVDEPVQTATWLGLTFGLLLGLVLIGRSHVGIRAAGVTLLIELVPLTVVVFGAGLSRGVGSARAALSTGAALTLVLLRFVL